MIARRRTRETQRRQVEEGLVQRVFDWTRGAASNSTA